MAHPEYIHDFSVDMVDISAEGLIEILSREGKKWCFQPEGGNYHGRISLRKKKRMNTLENEFEDFHWFVSPGGGKFYDLGSASSAFYSDKDHPEKQRVFYHCEVEGCNRKYITEKQYKKHCLLNHDQIVSDDDLPEPKPNDRRGRGEHGGGCPYRARILEEERDTIVEMVLEKLRES